MEAASINLILFHFSIFVSVVALVGVVVGSSVGMLGAGGEAGMPVMRFIEN